MITYLDYQVLKEISKRKPIQEVIDGSGIRSGTFFKKLKKFEKSGFVVKVQKKPAIYDVTVSGGILLYLLKKHEVVLGD